MGEFGDPIVNAGRISTPQWLKPPSYVPKNPYSGIIPDEIQALINRILAAVDDKEIARQLIFDILSGKIQLNTRVGVLRPTIKVADKYIRFMPDKAEFNALKVFWNKTKISEEMEEVVYLHDKSLNGLAASFVSKSASMFKGMDLGKLSLKAKGNLAKLAGLYKNELAALNIIGEITETRLGDEKFAKELISAFASIMSKGDNIEHTAKILAVETDTAAYENIKAFFSLVKEGKAKFGFKKTTEARIISLAPVKFGSFTVDSGVYLGEKDIKAAFPEIKGKNLQQLIDIVIFALGNILLVKGITRNVEKQNTLAVLSTFGSVLDKDALLKILSGTSMPIQASAAYQGLELPQSEQINIYFYNKNKPLNESSFIIKVGKKTAVVAKDGVIVTAENSKALKTLEKLLAKAGFSGPNLFENIVAFYNSNQAAISGVKEENVRAQASEKDINIGETERFNAYISDSIGSDREELIINYAEQICSKLENNENRKLVLKAAIVAIRYGRIGKKELSPEAIADLIQKMINVIDAVGDEEIKILEVLFKGADKQSKGMARDDALKMMGNAQGYTKVAEGLKDGNIKPDDLLNAFGIALYGVNDRKSPPSSAIVVREIKDAKAPILQRKAVAKELGKILLKDIAFTDVRQIAVDSKFVAAADKAILANSQAVRSDIPFALAVKYSPIISPDIFKRVDVKDPFRVIIKYIELAHKEGLLGALPQGFLLRLEKFANGEAPLDFADTQVLLNIMSNTDKVFVDILDKAVAEIKKSGKASEMLPVWSVYLTGEKKIVVMLDKGGNFGAVMQKPEKNSKPAAIIPSRGSNTVYGELEPKELGEDAPIANLINLILFVCPQHLSPEQYLSALKLGIIDNKLTASNIEGMVAVFDQRYLISHVQDDDFYSALSGLEKLVSGRINIPTIVVSREEREFETVSLASGTDHQKAVLKVIASMQNQSVGLAGKVEDQILVSKERGLLVEAGQYLNNVLEKGGEFKGREDVEAAKKYLNRMLSDLVPLADALNSEDTAMLAEFAGDLKLGKYGSTYILSADENKVHASMPNRGEYIKGLKVLRRLLKGLSDATYVQEKKPASVFGSFLHGIVEGAKQTREKQDLSLFNRPADGIIPMLKFVFFGGKLSEIEKVKAFRKRTIDLLGPSDPYSPDNLRIADNVAAKKSATKEPKVNDLAKLESELIGHLDSKELNAPENLGVRTLVLQMLVDIQQFKLNVRELRKRDELEKLLADISAEEIVGEEKKSGKPISGKNKKAKEKIEEYKKLLLSSQASLQFELLIKRSGVERAKAISALADYKWDGSKPDLEDIVRIASRGDSSKTASTLSELVETAKQLKKDKYEVLQCIAEFDDNFNEEIKPINKEKNKYASEHMKLTRYFTGNDLDKKLWGKIKTELKNAFQTNFNILQEVSGGSFVMDVTIDGQKIKIPSGDELIKFIDEKGFNDYWVDTSVSISDTEAVIYSKQALNMVLSTLPMEKLTWNPFTATATGVAGLLQQGVLAKLGIGRYVNFGTLGLAQSVIGLFGNREEGPKTWKDLVNIVNSGKPTYQLAQTASSISKPRSEAQQNLSQMFNAMFNPDPLLLLDKDNFTSQRSIGADAVKTFKKTLESKMGLIRNDGKLKNEYRELVESGEINLDLLDKKRFADVLSKLDALIAHLEKNNSRVPLLDPMHADDIGISDTKIRLALLYVSMITLDLQIVLNDVLSSQSIPTMVEGVVGYDPARFLKTIGYKDGEIRVSIVDNKTGESLYLPPIKKGEFRAPLLNQETKDGIRAAISDAREHPGANFFDSLKAGTFEGINFGIMMSYFILSGLAGYVVEGGEAAVHTVRSLIARVFDDKDEAELYWLKVELQAKHIKKEGTHEAGAFSQWELVLITALIRPAHALARGDLGYAVGFGAIGAPIAWHTFLTSLRAAKMIPEFVFGRPIAKARYQHSYGMVGSLLISPVQNTLSFLQDPKLGNRAIRKGEAKIAKGRSKIAQAQLLAQKGKAEKAQKLVAEGQKLISEGEALIKKGIRRQQGGLSRGMNWVGRGVNWPMRKLGEYVYDPLYKRVVYVVNKFRRSPKAAKAPSIKKPSVISRMWHHPLTDVVLAPTRLFRPGSLMGLRQDWHKNAAKRKAMKEFGLKTYAEAAQYAKLLVKARNDAIRKVLTSKANETYPGKLIPGKDGLIRISLSDQNIAEISRGKVPQKVTTGGLSSGEFAAVVKTAMPELGEAINNSEIELKKELGLGQPNPVKAHPAESQPEAAQPSQFNFEGELKATGIKCDLNGAFRDVPEIVQREFLQAAQKANGAGLIRIIIDDGVRFSNGGEAALGKVIEYLNSPKAIAGHRVIVISVENGAITIGHPPSLMDDSGHLSLGPRRWVAGKNGVGEMEAAGPAVHAEIESAFKNLEEALKNPKTVERLVKALKSDSHAMEKLRNSAEGRAYLKKLETLSRAHNFRERIRLEGGGLLVGLAVLIGVEKFVEMIGIEDKRGAFLAVLGISHMANLWTQSALVKYVSSKEAAQAQKILKALENPTVAGRIFGQFKNLFRGFGEMAFVSMCADFAMDKLGVKDQTAKKWANLGASFVVPAGTKMGIGKLAGKFGEATLEKIGLNGAGRLVFGVGLARFLTSDVVNTILSDYKLDVYRRAYDDIQTWRAGKGGVSAAGAFIVEFFHGIGGAASEAAAAKSFPKVVKPIIEGDIAKADAEKASLKDELVGYLTAGGDLAVLTKKAEFGTVSLPTGRTKWGRGSGDYYYEIPVVENISEEKVFEALLKYSKDHPEIKFGSKDHFSAVSAEFGGKATFAACERVLDIGIAVSLQARFAWLYSVQPSIFDGFEPSTYGDDIRLWFNKDGTLKQEVVGDFVKQFLKKENRQESEPAIAMKQSS